MRVTSIFSLLIAALISAPLTLAEDEGRTVDGEPRAATDAVPDLRDDDHDLTVQKRDLVIVPIPMSNPTLDTGLILAGAYFYRQTEEQKAVQPASMTGAAGFYTNNDSYGYGIGHQGYWNENKWRVGGVVGHANLKLDLLAQLPGVGGADIEWALEGDFLSARMSRKIAGKWYAGVFGRYMDFHQTFSIEPLESGFVIAGDTKSVGIGINAEYDNRDKPLNSYSGSIFEVDALFNSENLGGDDTYQSYSAKYRSYHSLAESVVLAWEVQGCARSDKAPLWDACMVDLRGFNATRFLGKSSASAQAEARWRFYGKLGAVAFAGGGYYRNAFSDTLEQDLIPSYGIGLRYMLLDSQRVNLRVDYARSRSKDAFYLSVGEAF